MKLVQFVTLALFATASFANPKANHFTCQSNEGLRFNYSTSSFIGQPTAGVGTIKDFLSFMGNEITRENTALGTLVSVNDNRSAMVDGPMLTYSLVLPDVSVGMKFEPVQFETVLLLTTKGGRFFIPEEGHVNGHTTATPVSCEAQVVVF